MAERDNAWDKATSRGPAAADGGEDAEEPGGSDEGTVDWTGISIPRDSDEDRPVNEAEDPGIPTPNEDCFLYKITEDHSDLVELTEAIDAFWSSSEMPRNRKEAREASGWQEHNFEIFNSNGQLHPEVKTTYHIVEDYFTIADPVDELHNFWLGMDAREAKTWEAIYRDVKALKPAENAEGNPAEILSAIKMDESENSTSYQESHKQTLAEHRLKNRGYFEGGGLNNSRLTEKGELAARYLTSLAQQGT